MADPLGVSIAFDADPMTPDPDWTRVDTLTGCRVRGWSIDRGRATEFDKTGTGTAVVQIVDRQGLFDPTNTTSVYAGKLTPGKQAAISLQNPVGDSWHGLFRGFVESWAYRLDPTRQYMELELQLVDGFAILSRAMLRVGIDGAQPPFSEFPAAQAAALTKLAKGNVLYGETADGAVLAGRTTTGTVCDRIEAVLGDIGWPVELSTPWHDATPGEIPDLFSGNVRVGPKAYGPGTAALDALWDAADAEFPGVSNMWISKDGHLIFRGRQARFRPDVAEYGIQRRTVGDPSAWSPDIDPDHLVVPVAELEWSNGEDNLYNAAAATPQGVGSGETWRQLDPSKDDVAGQHVQADDPALADTIGEPDSITKYGLRSITFDQLQTIEGLATHNDSMVETKQFATYYVLNYSKPAPRISRMVFKTRRPADPHGPAIWTHFCNCEISDLLTLITAHPGGGGFSSAGEADEFYVEGLHYTGSPSGADYPIIELTLDVSPQQNYVTNPFDSDPDPA